MDKAFLNGTVITAVTRAGETGTAIGRRVYDGVSAVNWGQVVPEAKRMLDLGAKLALARQGARIVSNTTRRHPVAVGAAATALAGIGLAVWLTRRYRENAEVIEAKPARKSSARKAPAKKTAAKKAGSARKAPARKRAPAKKAAASSGDSATSS